MARRPVGRLGLSNEITASLTAVGIDTARDLLSSPPLKISLAANLSYQQVQTLLAHTSEKIAPKCVTALDKLNEARTRQRFLSTGDNALDSILRGGLLNGTLSDICGAPGVGKTQFCLCLAAMLLVSDPLKTVIFVDAEAKLDAARLVQICVERFPEKFSANLCTDAAHNIEALTSRVKVLRPKSTTELEELVNGFEEYVVVENAGLVVIDSIAALVRKENMNEASREKLFATLAQRLKLISENCYCAVIATNQVTPAGAATARLGENWFGEEINHEGVQYISTLGPTMHHCVTTRFIMQRESSLSITGPPVTTATICVSKSPLVKRSVIPYCITSKGFECPTETLN